MGASPEVRSNLVAEVIPGIGIELLAVFRSGGVKSAYLDENALTLRQKVEMLPRVLPFVILLIGVMVALYGGLATPSETAGLGAVLAIVLIASIYGMWRPRDLAPILAATLRESTMLMLIIMRLSSTGYSGAAALARNCEPVPSVRVASGAPGSRMPGVA